MGLSDRLRISELSGNDIDGDGITKFLPRRNITAIDNQTIAQLHPLLCDLGLIVAGTCRRDDLSAHEQSMSIPRFAGRVGWVIMPRMQRG